MKVELERVKEAINLIIDWIIESRGGVIELENDFYWNVLQEEVYNPYQSPSNFDLGQLSDDLEEIMKIARGKNIPLGYGLVWASSLLRAIGEKTVY